MVGWGTEGGRRQGGGSGGGGDQGFLLRGDVSKRSRACCAEPQLRAYPGNVCTSFCFILRCRSKNVHRGGNALNWASSSGPDSKSTPKTVGVSPGPLLAGQDG